MCSKSVSISVVIPTFNRSYCIAECVSSVLDQVYSVNEIIIVDDASEDQLALIEEVNKIGDPRICLELLSRNMGGGAARNRGIQLATSELVFFLDSDDLWEPDHVANIVRLAISELGRKVLVYSRVKKMAGLKFVGEFPIEQYDGLSDVSDYLLLEKGLMQTSGIAITKKANDLFFNENYKRHQDYDFVLSAYQKGYRFRFNREASVIWRIEGKGASLRKGADYKFCSFWRHDNRLRMSTQAYAAYTLNVLVPAALREFRYISATKEFIQQFKKVSGSRIRGNTTLYIKAFFYPYISWFL